MASSLIKYMLSIILFICIAFLNHAFAGSYTNSIKDECPDHYKHYSETVKTYAVRMLPAIEKYNCGVVGLYVVLADDHIQIIDSFNEKAEDDYNNLWEAAVNLFNSSNNIQLIRVLKDSPTATEILVKLYQEDHEVFESLASLLTSLSEFEVKNIQREPSQLFIYLLASSLINSEENKNDDIHSLIGKIKRNYISSNPELFISLFVQAKALYIDEDLDYWLKVTKDTLRIIGSDNLTQINQYPEYLVYFLPPSNENIPEVQNMRSREAIEKIKRDYQETILSIYDNLTSASNIYDKSHALKVIQYLEPAIIDALRYENNPNEIKKYLEYQFKNQLFIDAFTQGVCKKEEDIEDYLLQSFLSMFAPYNAETGEKIVGTKGNLGLIAHWFSENDNLKTFIKRYTEQNTAYTDFSHVNNFINIMSILPSIYYRKLENNRQRAYFNDLLLTLNNSTQANDVTNVSANAYFLIILSKVNYFHDIEKIMDIEHVVSHNSDATYGVNAPKYKYILITSYPTDGAFSLYQNIVYRLSKDKDGKEKDSEIVLREILPDLLSMSIAELNEHNFTDSEKLWKKYDQIDNVVTVVSIALIPFTGGASIAGVGALLGKKGGKTILKNSRRKLAIKNMAKIMGKAPKSTKEGMKSIAKVIEPLDDAATAITVGRIGAGLLIGTSLLLDREETIEKNSGICEDKQQ